MHRAAKATIILLATVFTSCASLPEKSPENEVTNDNNRTENVTIDIRQGTIIDLPKPNLLRGEGLEDVLNKNISENSAKCPVYLALYKADSDGDLIRRAEEFFRIIYANKPGILYRANDDVHSDLYNIAKTKLEELAATTDTTITFPVLMFFDNGENIGTEQLNAIVLPDFLTITRDTWNTEILPTYLLTPNVRND